MKTTGYDHHRSKRTKLAITLLVILGIVAIAAIILMRSQSDQRTPTSTNPSSKSERSKQATSEGTTFPVPDDLPDDAIQDYVLVTENEEYKIRRYGNTDRYTITLYAIINNPGQYSTYKDQLREYKQHALEYLKKQGIDTSQIEVTYDPKEAADL